jgi:hypothetical protein
LSAGRHGIRNMTQTSVCVSALKHGIGFVSEALRECKGSK